MIPNDIPAGRYCGECSFNRENADNTGYSCTIIDNTLEGCQDRGSGVWDILRDEECVKRYPYGGIVMIGKREKS